MNLDYLHYFVKLAHIKHYTKAAEELCITQPSLSHAINQLEKELGVPLFEKFGRKSTLTRFGEEFLICAENTLSTLNEGISSIKRSAKGEGLIRLGLIRPLGINFIPELAANFLAENSDKNISFTFHTGITNQLIDGLIAKKYDLIFTSQPPEKFSFNAIPIKRQDLVLIVPKNHILSSKDEVELLEIIPYPMIYFTKDTGIRSVIDSLFLQIDSTPKIIYETEEDQVIAGLVAKNFGIAIVPYMELLLKLDVKIIKIKAPNCRREFFMINDEKVFMPPVVRRFYEFVLNCCNNEPLTN